MAFEIKKYTNIFEDMRNGIPPALDDFEVGSVTRTLVESFSYELALLYDRQANATVEASLARDPDNPYTHQAQGFAMLQQGDAKRALKHFQEALRLSPGFEPARNGLLVALRAKNPAYRLLLRFFLWMQS